MTSHRCPVRSARAALAILALCVALVPRAADEARDLASVAPAAVGMSADGLRAVDALIGQLIAAGELAGAVVAVARHGKIAHFEAFGQRDIAANTPMTKDTIFRIHSMTKPIAGVALMTFYDEGRFTLDDPVAKHIPAFKGLQVAAGAGENGELQLQDAGHAMTIRELVSHTGGFTYGLFSRSAVDALYRDADLLDRNATLAEMVGKLGALPLLHQPGTRWHYSIAADVQGYLVEVLAGKPFDTVLKERIFDPLGMKDTAFWVVAEDAGRLSPLYRSTPSRGLVAMPAREALVRPRFFSGGGGLVSTAMDYLRFCQMLLNGGELDGVRILEADTARLMHTSQLPDAVQFIDSRLGGPGNTFGIDFAIVEQPDAGTDHPLAQGEYWWYGIGGTWFGINPIQDLVIVGMMQSLGGAGARKARVDGKRLVYEAIAVPTAP